MTYRLIDFVQVMRDVPWKETTDQTYTYNPTTKMSDLEPIERAAFLGELRTLLQSYEPLRDRKTIESFLEVVGSRVEKGAQEYGDASPKRAFADLVDEMMQEAADIAGWACQAWRRVNRLASNRTMHADHPLVMLSNLLMQRADDAFHLWEELQSMRDGIAKTADRKA